MRHQKKKTTLDRARGPRRALLRGLLVNFFLNQKIKTTAAKAKAIKPIAERLITRAQKNNLAARRYLLARLNDRKAVDKLIKDIAPKYKERKGGYTRVIKLGTRQGDGADIAQIELV